LTALAPSRGRARQPAAPAEAGRETLTGAAILGAVAGLAGGTAFGAAITELGNLPAMALLLLAGSPVLGFVAHILVSAMVGAIFGVLVRWGRPGPGETVCIGVAFGALWWYLLPLTLMPVLLGVAPAWDLATAQQQLPGLLGHLLYGGVTGLALVVLRRPAGWPAGITPGRLLTGALAGGLGTWLVAAALAGHLEPAVAAATADRSPTLAPLVAGLVVGPLFGIGWVLLYPGRQVPAGVALVRGQAYGFLWWVGAELTVVSVLNGNGLAWSVEQARTRFPSLVGFVLAGTAVALLDGRLAALSRLLFSDDAPSRSTRGGLGALLRDAAAGTAGGLLFTLVTWQTGILAELARLVGGTMAAGLTVHLLVATVLGISYGQLFRRDAWELGTAMAWGVAYGLLWWLLGALTLLPMLLGGAPQWSAAAAAAAFPSLVGHITYGIGLGAAFNVLETRLGLGRARRLLNDPALARPAGAPSPDESAAGPLWAVLLVLLLIVSVVVAGPAGP
jgi:uncharacterized membrane protein YagU involved in acid resistance